MNIAGWRGRGHALRDVNRRPDNRKVETLRRTYVADEDLAAGNTHGQVNHFKIFPPGDPADPKVRKPPLDFLSGLHRRQVRIIQRNGRAEYGKHGISHKLVNRTAAMKNHLGKNLKKLVQEGAENDQLDMLYQAGRLPDIGEKNGHLLDSAEFEQITAAGDQ